MVEWPSDRCPRPSRRRVTLAGRLDEPLSTIDAACAAAAARHTRRRMPPRHERWPAKFANLQAASIAGRAAVARRSPGQAARTRTNRRAVRHTGAADPPGRRPPGRAHVDAAGPRQFDCNLRQRPCPLHSSPGRLPVHQCRDLLVRTLLDSLADAAPHSDQASRCSSSTGRAGAVADKRVQRRPGTGRADRLAEARLTRAGVRTGRCSSARRPRSGIRHRQRQPGRCPADGRWSVVAVLYADHRWPRQSARRARHR